MVSEQSDNSKDKNKLKVGDNAPDFESYDKDGKLVTLKDFQGKILVFYFYPKDESSICTAEACEFRDKYESFIRAGAVVVGVSQDNSESHTKFTSKYKLPFTLLTDEKGKLAKKYRVKKELVFLPGRKTFIIDQNQKIIHIYSNLLNGTQHITESLKIIENLNQFSE